MEFHEEYETEIRDSVGRLPQQQIRVYMLMHRKGVRKDMFSCDFEESDNKTTPHSVICCQESQRAKISQNTTIIIVDERFSIASFLAMTSKGLSQKKYIVGVRHCLP